MTYEIFRAAQKTTDTHAGTMAYCEAGQGNEKALLLLHGVPTSSWLYRKVIPGLAKNYRVVAPDFIGFGSSAKPVGDMSVYAPAARAKRVRKLMTELGIEKFSIMTHDMGGLVTWEMMKQDIDSIEDLIILNTIVHSEGFFPPNMKKNMLTEQLMKAYSNRWTSAAIWMLTARNLGLKSTRKLSEEECLGYVTPLREGSDKALYSFFTSLDKEMLAKLEYNRDVFQQFNGRTLVLWGEIDETLTTAQIPFLKEHLRIPDEMVCVYPENAHFLTEEIPDEVVTQVNAFLQTSE